MKPIKTVMLAFSFLACHGMVLSQVIDGRLSTSVYSWEKFNAVDSSKKIVRGYQNAQLDVVQDNISFHTYISAAGNFSDDEFIRVNNAFLRWKNIGDIVDLRLGRMPVFAGVGNGTLDGVMLKARWWDDKIALTGYGGANVKSDMRSLGFSDLSRNFFVGGHLTGDIPGGARLSLSYVNRHRKPDDYTALRPDSLFDASAVYVSPDTRIEQLFGADARYNYRGLHSAYGRFDYDISSKHSVRGEMGVRISATKCIAFTGTYVYREPRLPFNSFFSVFPLMPVREYEGGAEYKFSRLISAFGRFAYVAYNDDMSRRLTGGVSFPYGSLSYSGSNGYSGQLSSFNIECMYPLFDRMLIPTLAFSYAAYRLEEGISQKENIYTASLGAIYRPLAGFSFDGQLQWLRNKVADRDLRVFGRVSYWFSHNFSQLQRKETGE